ncbi:MAG: hypothetical protein WC718_02250 [Phycisphaerales bacterium]|jgi:hypothetical protein
MPPKCLKCGYDVSGEIATWDAAGACPLEGTCPECGGALHWKEVFSPEGGRLIGFVEDAYGVRRRFTWAFRTLWWALWPWKFWGKVGDYERVRALNWVWWVLAVIWLPRMVAGAGFLALSLLLMRVNVPAGATMGVRGWKIDWLSELIGNHFRFEMVLHGRVLSGVFSAWPRAYVWLGLEIIAWPLAMAVLSDYVRAGGLRGLQIVRATLFSLTPFAVLGLIGLAVRAVLVVAWVGGIISEWFGMAARGTYNIDWVFQTMYPFLQRGRQLDEIVAWLGIPWVCLWWLAAATRGFKVERGAQAWIVQVILINVILFFLFGPRIDPWTW